MVEQGGIDREFLRTTPLFGGLPDAALATIAQVARVVELEAGTVLVHEGEPGRCLYVVHDGELEICKRRGGDGETRLAVLPPGACVGEMALIEIQPRSATVRALTRATVFALDQNEIARLYHAELEVYTLLVLNIARELSRRLRRADERLSDIDSLVSLVHENTLSST